MFIPGGSGTSGFSLAILDSHWQFWILTGNSGFSLAILDSRWQFWILTGNSGFYCVGRRILAIPKLRSKIRGRLCQGLQVCRIQLMLPVHQDPTKKNLNPSLSSCLRFWVATRVGLMFLIAQVLLWTLARKFRWSRDRKIVGHCFTKSGSLVFGCLALSVALLGCRAWEVNDFQDRLQPSNDRQWSPEFSRLPTAQINGDFVTLRNVRNIEWLSEEDFVLKYYDRTININDVQAVDFVVVPFAFQAIAHTMLSFELADGTYFGVSVEIRTEKGEDYSSIMGAARQFEVTYLVADERDIIRRRTRHLNADVYVYPTVATPQQAKLLLLDIMQRMNELANKPEFYNTLVNNCTTNIVSHVNRLNPSRIPYNIGILLPGLSDKYAYDLGILDKSVPFATLKQAAYVNDLAAVYYEDPQFSQKIRAKRNLIQTVGK